MSAVILVTGGGGYIGSHAVLALLERGFQPVVIDDLSTGSEAAIPEGVQLHVGNVGDREFVARVLEQTRPAGMMHFAGSIIVEESVQNPEKYYQNNTNNTLALISSWLAYGAGSFIFSSTAAVYGSPPVQPVAEATPKHPLSPYGASKSMAEDIIRDVAAAHPEFRPVCLRYFNVAGADPGGRAGQRGPQSTHLIRVAVEVALGLRPRMSVYGTDYDTRDGSCERDFIHVSDLATAHVSALDYLMNGGTPAIFNCGYGKGYTVLEVIAALEAIVGRRLPVDVAGRRAGDIPQLISDPSALRSRLGWTPQHEDLDTILRSALAWQGKLRD